MQANQPVIVAVVALVTGSAFAGLPLLDQGSKAATAEAAPLAGPATRHRNWTFRDAGWVDVAFNMTPELDPEDVHVEVTAHGEPRRNPGRDAVWASWVAAPETSEILSEQGYARSFGWLWTPTEHDDWWEFGVEHGPHEQRVTLSEPWCQIYDCSASYDYKITTDSLERDGFYQDFREEFNASVVHWTVMVGGVAAERVEVDATYRGTSVNVTSGPPSDLFSYQRDDFDAEHAAWTEWHAWRRNATLTTELEPGPGPVFFHYEPFAPGGGGELNEGPTWYVEPDGERRTEVLTDLSGEDGRWTFGYRQSGAQHADVPVLYGAGFQWAELDG